MTDKTKSIVITFPVGVDFPPGLEHVLAGLVDMICMAYEHDNPTRVMWPAGQGSLPTSDFWAVDPDKLKPGEKYEPFDNSCYSIQVSEREAYEDDLLKRGFHLVNSKCQDCDSIQFYTMQGGLGTLPIYKCANGHIHEDQGVKFEVMHILQAGHSMCHRVKGVPGEWGEGHRWVGFSDIVTGREQLSLVTCTRCQSAYASRMKNN